MSRLFKALIAVSACFLLLSFSCSRKQENGSPYILYEMHGTVSDADGSPLTGISVWADGADAVTTGESGSFSLNGRTSPSTFVTVCCEDKEGIWLSSSVNVELNLNSAGSGMFKGYYFRKDVTIRLIPKEQELLPADPDAVLH